LLAVSGLIAGNPGVWQASVAGFPDLFNLPSAAGAAGGQPHCRSTPHCRATLPRHAGAPHCQIHRHANRLAPPAAATVAPPPRASRTPSGAGCGGDQDRHTSAPHRGGVARDTSAAVSDRARRRSSAVPSVAPPRQGHRGRQAALAAAVNQDGHTSAPSRGGVARDTTPAVSDGAQLRISGEGLSGATPSKGATRGWRRLLSLTAATTAATDC
jgi:hypothetical protein